MSKFTYRIKLKTSPYYNPGLDGRHRKMKAIAQGARYWRN
jgi:hypothetical protein